jgi:hypothetical protein
MKHRAPCDWETRTQDRVCADLALATRRHVTLRAAALTSSATDQAAAPRQGGASSLVTAPRQIATNRGRVLSTSDLWAQLGIAVWRIASTSPG